MDNEDSIEHEDNIIEMEEGYEKQPQAVIVTLAGMQLIGYTVEEVKELHDPVRSFVDMLANAKEKSSVKVGF